MDVRQTVAADQREIRWDYTVVLKETAGVGIQFEKVQLRSGGRLTDDRITEREFRRRLEPHSELRHNRTHLIYFTPDATPTFGVSVPGGSGGVDLLLRYQGQDDTGKRVNVDLRFRLDPSTGTGTETLQVAATRPPTPTIKTEIAGLPPADVPPWKLGYEWAYRWESPRGSGTFVWTVAREEKVDGTDFYVIRSGTPGASIGHREIYYRKTDLAHYMERIGERIETRHVPPRSYLVWPLSVGRQWEESYVLENLPDRSTENLITTSRVESSERVIVSGGNFGAFKIVSRNRRTDNIEYEVWYCPEVKQWIRDKSYFSYGTRTRELTSFKLDSPS